MDIPPIISFRNLPKRPDIEQLIFEKVDQLERFCHHITSCRIVVEREQSPNKLGSPYRVRIDVTVPPGHELVAERDSRQGTNHDRLPTLIHETFQAARRQLKELVEKQRREVKAHPEQQATAVVTKLYRGDGYGFLLSVEGREVYFHRNSVLHGDFDRLEVGTGVRFVEEVGEKGLQASTVQLVDKAGPRIGAESVPEAASEAEAPAEATENAPGGEPPGEA